VWNVSSANNGDTAIINLDGEYKIHCWGGGNDSTFGGDIIARADLKVGDKLQFIYYKGGNPGTNYLGTGGDATLVLLNGTPLVGAGGIGGGNTGGYCTPVTYINNQTFSSGGGGGRGWTHGRNDTYSSCQGEDGNTFQGLTPASGCKQPGGYNPTYDGPGSAGTNYLDVDRASLMAQSNCSTLSVGKVEASYLITPESQNPKSLKQIAESSSSIASSLKNINNKLGAPDKTKENPDIITVVAGKSFDEYVNVQNDAIVSGSDKGIQVINNNSNDNVVRILGKIDNPGNYQIIVNEVIYTFKVISEPNSSNVTVILK